MKKSLLVISAWIAAAQLNAQTHGALNPDFNGVDGTDSYVQALPNGKILLGAGYYVGSSVPVVLNADGSVDATFNLPFIEDHYPVAIHNSNGIYMLGTAVARCSETGTFNINSDNYTQNFGLNGNQFNGRVSNAVLLPDGSIIAVGNFDYVYHVSGSFAENHIVKYNADLSVNATFMTNVTTGFNAEVTAIALDTVNDKIYCGGKFTQYNGNTAKGICRLNYDGTIDNTFDPGTGFEAPTQFPKFMKVLSDGRLFVSGATIDTYDGISCNMSLMLNNGSLVNTFGITHQINDLEEVSENVLLVVGETIPYDIQYANSITGAFLNNNSDYPQFNFPDDFGTNNQTSTSKIKTITKSNSGSFFLSGSFILFNLQTVNNIVELQLCTSDPGQFYSVNGNELTAIEGQSYSWNAYDANENTLGSSTNQTFTHIPGAEFYSLTVIDGICEYHTSFEAGTLSTNDVKTHLFNLFPNPATSHFTLTDLPVNATIQVADQTGRVVKSEMSTAQTATLSTVDMHSGIYFVHVTGKNGETNTQKLVIE